VLQLGKVEHDLRISLEVTRDLNRSSDLLVLSVVENNLGKVGIWSGDVLVEVVDLEGVPHTNNSSASLFLGGVKHDSVVDEKRFEDVGKDWESKHSSGVSKDGDGGNNQLDDVVVPFRCRDSLEHVSEDIHEHEVVVSNVLVLSILLSFQNVSVDEFVIGIDNLQRQLGEGVVDSVVVNSPVSEDSDNSDGGSEESIFGGNGVGIEASVAVEGVSLVVSGVCEGSRGNNGSLIDYKRNGVEAEDVEGVEVDHFNEHSRHVGVETKSFDDHLGSVQLLLGAVFLVHKDGKDGPWTSIIHRRKGDKWEPDVGEHSRNVRNIGVVSGHVSSSVGFLRHTSERNHDFVNESVQRN